MPYSDPEKRKEYLRLWKLLHPDAEKTWRANNQDRIRAGNNRRYAQDPERKKRATSFRRKQAGMLAEVRQACDHICAYCLKPADTIDHALPVSRGGADDESNLVACCLPCNARKGAQTPLEFLFGWPRC